MAEVLGGVAFPSFVATSLVLGFRLLRLAARTRALPELAMGVNFVMAGTVGYTLLIAAESLGVLGSWTGAGSFAGVVALSIGTAAIGLFTQRVFHPESRAARACLSVLCIWLALGIAGSWVLHVERAESGAGVWLGHWAPNVGMLAAFAWATGDALTWWRRMRLRAAVGLADPLVANRMLLWGIGSLGMAAVAALHLAASLAGTRELPPSLVGVVSLLLIATALAEWLAFFPPRAYRQRFASSGAAAR
jgi:hypothetical protein